MVLRWSSIVLILNLVCLEETNLIMEGNSVKERKHVYSAVLMFYKEKRILTKKKVQ